MVGCVLAGKTWCSRHQLSANARFNACFDCCNAKWHSARGCCQLQNMAKDADGASSGISFCIKLVGWFSGAATIQQSNPLLHMSFSSFCVAWYRSFMRLEFSCLPDNTSCGPAFQSSQIAGHLLWTVGSQNYCSKHAGHHDSWTMPWTISNTCKACLWRTSSTSAVS